MRAGTILSAFLLFSLSACSLVGNFGKNQCSTNGDCQAKGPGFSGYLCSEDKVCVQPPSINSNNGTICQFDTDCAGQGENFICNPQGICAAGTACQSDNECTSLGPDYVKYNCSPKGICKKGFDCTEKGNSQCTTDYQGQEYAAYSVCNSQKVCSKVPDCATDKNCTDLGAGFENYICLGTKCAQRSTDVCASNVQCTSEKNDGNIYICKTRGTPCAPLKTKECTNIVPADGYKNQNSIFVGAVTNVVDTSKLTTAKSIELAMGEINTGSSGIPGGPGGGRRPLVAVICNGGKNTDALNRAVDHVIGEVGVDAMLMGSLAAADFTSIFLNKAVPNNVFVLTTDINDPTFSAFTSAQTKDLLWRNIGALLGLAPPYVPLLAKTEATVRAKKSLSNSTPIKVAMITADFPDAVSLSEAIKQNIRFNGGKAVKDDAANFINIVTPPDDPSLSYASLVNQLKNFRPDIVIPVASVEFEDHILPEYEAALGASDWHPYYLTSAFITPPDLIAQVNAIPGVGSRIAGVTDANPDNFTWQDNFASRYRTKFGLAADDSSPYGGIFAYDAAYILSFAFAANASRATISGANLASVMPSFGNGNLFNIDGPNTVGQAINALASGASLSPYGTTGPIHFDANGSRSSEASVYCFLNGDLAQDVVRYDNDTKTLVGNFTCY